MPCSSRPSGTRDPRRSVGLSLALAASLGLACLAAGAAHAVVQVAFEAGSAGGPRGETAAGGEETGGETAGSAGAVGRWSGIASGEPSGRERWARLPLVGGHGAEPSALARSGRSDLAVGDERGVSWWREGATERAVLPPVRDVDFDAQGVLWIATLEGLYVWRRADRPVARRLPGGEASNRVHRLAVSETALLVATEAGAYWSADGRIFQLLRVAGAATPVSQVAIRPAQRVRSDASVTRSGARSVEAWLYGSGRLSVVRGFEAAAGLRVIEAESLPLPRPVGEGEPVDLTLDPAGDRLYLVFEDLIASRPLAAGASEGPGGWRLERPGLPPGAVIRRLGWAAGRVWITTDHGLVEGASLAGPLRRSSSPVGTTDCVELRARPPAEALALCRGGLFLLTSLDAPDPTYATQPALALPPDPPLVEIRRRALWRAGLHAERSRSLWDRLRQRAFWPEIGLRFDADFDSDHQDDRDQSFVSGETRRLHDRSRDEGRNYRAAIEFDWDLGGVVYPLESVDLSRELRQVVSLRDDVADEINQLYFERQTIREQLARSRSTPIEDTRRLWWRARELDAGLDAWTGGWITQWRALHPVERAFDSGWDEALDTGSVLHPDHTQERKMER